ncbi:ParA family protein [Nocardioides maradonensis]
MKIFAICNQKGGVGKSTTTYHLARAAVRAQLRVLVIDIDPQGNLTSVITSEASDPQFRTYAGVADVLHEGDGQAKAREVLLPGIWDGLTVMPTPNARTLAVVGQNLVTGRLGKERRLAEAVADLADDFDLCLIDCPPSLDQLTINALAAADGVVVVAEARLWAADGLAHLLETVEDVRKYFNPELHVAGVVINRFERRTVSAEHWLEQLRTDSEQRGLRILEPIVHKRVSIADSVESSTALDLDWGEQGREIAAGYDAHLNALMNGAVA